MGEGLRITPLDDMPHNRVYFSLPSVSPTEICAFGRPRDYSNCHATVPGMHLLSKIRTGGFSPHVDFVPIPARPCGGSPQRRRSRSPASQIGLPTEPGDAR
jgi:hypothetical protein